MSNEISKHKKENSLCIKNSLNLYQKKGIKNQGMRVQQQRRLGLSCSEGGLAVCMNLVQIKKDNNEDFIVS